MSDKEITVARVYSNAMLRLAEAKGEADSLFEEMDQLVSLLDAHEDLDGFLASPMIDPEVRKVSLEKLFRGKASDLLVDSLQILNEKERLDLIRAVAQTYRLDHAEMRGWVDAHVRTAVPLSDGLRTQLEEVVSKRTGRRGRLEEAVDESLLGGVVVQIGDEKLDASVTTKLQRLGELLSERGSREVYSGKDYVEAGE
ncbi:MAG: ATP synthase F1 subunit delta [Phycisphaerales bacterium]|nr:MAG: ATP synthase F1 subunit delta [Phycisphaerales bacterium]